MTNKPIVAKDRKHLKALIRETIEKEGSECDLNFIDVSNVTDMTWMFKGSRFNGDISKWNVSNVLVMWGMFSGSRFNGDISKWDVSSVMDMSDMFFDSCFDGDISKWDLHGINVKYLGLDK